METLNQNYDRDHDERRAGRPETPETTHLYDLQAALEALPTEEVSVAKIMEAATQHFPDSTDEDRMENLYIVCTAMEGHFPNKAKKLREVLGIK